jgi:hypothetical protein
MSTIIYERVVKLNYEPLSVLNHKKQILLDFTIFPYKILLDNHTKNKKELYFVFTFPVCNYFPCLFIHFIFRFILRTQNHA